MDRFSGYGFRYYSELKNSINYIRLSLWQATS